MYPLNDFFAALDRISNGDEPVQHKTAVISDGHCATYNIAIYDGNVVDFQAYDLDINDLVNVISLDPQLNLDNCEGVDGRIKMAFLMLNY